MNSSTYIINLNSLHTNALSEKSQLLPSRFTYQFFQKTKTAYLHSLLGQIQLLLTSPVDKKGGEL